MFLMRAVASDTELCQLIRFLFNVGRAYNSQNILRLMYDNHNQSEKRFKILHSYLRATCREAKIRLCLRENKRRSTHY
jgi:hypothetical protein